MNTDTNENLSFLTSNVDVFTIIHDVFKGWWMILMSGIAAALLVTSLLSFTYVPKYTTTCTFVVVSKTNDRTYSNTSSTYTLAEVFQKVLESSVLKKAVMKDLGVEELNSTITSEIVEGTNFMALTVEAGTAKEAIDTIQSIINHYTDVSLYTMGDAVMQVIQEPGIPYSPSNPLNTREDAKKAFVVGAGIMILLLAVLSYMNDTVKQESEIEKKLDAKNLGIINYERKYKSLGEAISRKKKAVLIENPIAGFRFVENYKKLATNIRYQMKKDDRKVLVVTSVAENEGKSTVAANLALSLAQQGKKVVLIDGDIRKPSQHLILGVTPAENGQITDFMRGLEPMKNVICPTGRSNLLFIGGTKKVDGSTELLGASDNLEKMVTACKNAADYVIIDTPPAGLIGDAAIFASYADAVLLVVKQNYILSEDINDIIDGLRDSGSAILGVVLNGVQGFSTLTETTIGRYGKYGGYGGYGHYGRYGNYGKYGAYDRRKTKATGENGGAVNGKSE